jgi:PKD repeat protein
MLAVTVNNVAPTVNTPTISPEPSLAGAPVVASATFSDPGTLDTFTCTVNYGDGSGNLAGTVSVYTCTGPSHVYASAGNYTVTVSVTDDDLGNGSNSTTHAVIPSATIQVIAASHSVGSGSAPGTVKYPLPLALEVYDKTPAGTGYPSLDPKNFASIYEYEPPSGGTNLATTSPPKAHISGPADITHGGGPAKLYTILVPAGFPNALGTSGAYLVIGKGLVPPANLITVYPGSPTDVLTANTTTQKYLQAGTNGAGKTFPMKTTSVPGSLLLIAEPEYLEFTSDTELLPVIYESIDGDWGSNIQVDVPEGFVATPGTLQADVTTGTTDVTQFNVKDIGSDWTHTTVTHRLKHKGRNITVTSQTPMINRQPPRPPQPPRGGGGR